MPSDIVCPPQVAVCFAGFFPSGEKTMKVPLPFAEQDGDLEGELRSQCLSRYSLEKAVCIWKIILLGDESGTLFFGTG